ncbi:hypothetical protein RJ55_08226 [Drechmeria coniospora]|nr:hypothetical protein RJ55_08226 [Drechmeria coniospora]
MISFKPFLRRWPKGNSPSGLRKLLPDLRDKCKDIPDMKSATWSSHATPWDAELGVPTQASEHQRSNPESTTSEQNLASWNSEQPEADQIRLPVTATTAGGLQPAESSIPRNGSADADTTAGRDDGHGFKHQQVYRLEPMDAIRALSSKNTADFDIRLTVPLFPGAKPFITFHCTPTLTRRFLKEREMLKEFTQ